MAPIGPIAKALAQIAVLGISVLARAIPAAYGAALQNAKKNGVQGASSAIHHAKGGMRKAEALEILNITEKEYTVEMVQKQFDRYFADNAIEKGGSFYLQSKIYRAKELLDEYEKEKETKEQKKEA